MKKDQGDPSPTEMTGRDLKPGMVTYQRVIKRGEVTFRQDEVLIERINNAGNPVHKLCADFKTRKHSQVCYFINGRVWAKGPFENLEQFDEQSKKG